MGTGGTTDCEMGQVLPLYKQKGGGVVLWKLGEMSLKFYSVSMVLTKSFIPRCFDFVAHLLLSAYLIMTTP